MSRHEPMHATGASGAQGATPSMETYRGIVYPWHCDHVGHMNVMWYVGKFDEATWFFFNRIGLTRALLAEQKRGMAAVEQRIAYQREVRAGDALAVDTTLLEVRDKVLRFAHRMRIADSGEVAAVMVRTTVYLDMERRRAAPLPDAVRERARGLVTTLALPWDTPR
jgi:acyl-CoA thioester hydrolase